MDNANVLFTIGYEGRTLIDLISCLEKYRIRSIVDVREVPNSRKQGFSKRSLSKVLQEHGIEYIHIKQLGSPRNIRHKLKEDKNYKAFFRAYSNHLDRNLIVIVEVMEHTFKATCCLMCFERNPEECHRSIIANKIKEMNHNGLKIFNIIED